MATRFPAYRMVDGKTLLAAAYFNAIWQDLDLRVGALEEVDKAWQDAVAALNEVGLDRINEVLLPAFAKVQELASFGFLTADADPASPIGFETGDQQLVIPAGPQRDLFTPTPFVVLTRAANTTDWAIARAGDYDAETGLLSYTIEQIGPDTTTGPFTDVTVGAAAGGAVVALRALTAAAQAATSATDAATAKAAAASSAEAAAASEGDAGTAATAAVAAATAAQGYRDEIDPTSFATAAQGAKADTALQKASNLSDISDAAAALSNLGGATAAQGAKADTALQPSAIASGGSAGLLRADGDGSGLTDLPVLGVGQTWQDVQASRAANTPYQNTTGRSIVVFLYLYKATGTNKSVIQMSSDNSTWTTFAQFGTTTMGTIVVPPGYYYKAIADTITTWMELR